MKTRTIVGVTAIPLFLLLILFAPLWGYAIVVGLIYILLCSILSFVATRLERRSGMQRRPRTGFGNRIGTPSAEALELPV